MDLSQTIGGSVFCPSTFCGYRRWKTPKASPLTRLTSHGPSGLIIFWLLHPTCVHATVELTRLDPRAKSYRAPWLSLALSPRRESSEVSHARTHTHTLSLLEDLEIFDWSRDSWLRTVLETTGSRNFRRLMRKFLSARRSILVAMFIDLPLMPSGGNIPRGIT